MRKSVFRLASIAALAASSLAAHADVFLGALDGKSFYLTSAFGSALSQEAYAVGRGGHLASIHSLAEQTLVSAGVRANATGGSSLAWIGFTDQAVEGTFQWFDGSAVDYTFWSGGEPNDLGGEDYTVVNWGSNGEWNDLDSNYDIQAVYSVDAVPGPAAALPFALMAIKRRRKRA